MNTRLTSAAWLSAPETRTVMAALEAAQPGGARFVGGCVRNTQLGQGATISTSPPCSCAIR